MNLVTIEKFMWLAIALYWLISSISVKRSIKKQSGWQRTAYIICVLLAFCLLFEDYFNFSFLYKPILPQNNYWKIAGFILCAAGLLFALISEDLARKKLERPDHHQGKP